MRARRHRYTPLIELLDPRRLMSTVSVAPATAAESSGALTFHVSLDAASTEDVSLTYATTPLTATPGKDYQPAAGKLTIPAGQTSADITVNLKDDSLYEDTETLKLHLHATGAKLAQPTATGTITDDDAAPAVTVNDVTTKEGNAGRHFVTLDVTLSKPASSRLSLQYATSDDSPHYLAATAGSDYSGAAIGTLTFRPGQTKKTIRVAIKGDKAVESDESFLLTLTAQGAPVATATVTIQNDDQPAESDAPILTLADATVAETDAAPALTVTLSKPATRDITFRYAATQHTTTYTSNGFTFVTPTIIVAPPLGGASAGSNFTPTQGALTIPAGQTSATIPLSLVNDSLQEPTYTLDVTLSSAKGAALPNNHTSATAHVTVTDDDPLPSPIFVNPQLYQSIAFQPSEFTLTTVGAVTGGTLQSNFNPGPITAIVQSYNPDPVTTGAATTVTGGTLTLNGSGTLTGFQGATLTLAGMARTGTGTLTLGNPPLLAGGSTSVTLAAPPNLSLLSGSNLLLSPGTALTFPAGTSPDAVRSLILSAFNAGLWNGTTGLTSSAAAADPDHRTAVGYAPQPDGSVLAKPALYGDANLDGTVDATDAAIVQQSLTNNTPASWSAGDFNYDGQITPDDLALLDRNLGRSL